MTRFAEPAPLTFTVRIALTPDRPADLPLPAYAKPGDAGLDLVASAGAMLQRMSRGGEDEARALVSTGLRFEIPPGYVGLICPRSGLASRDGVVAVLGVVDSGYRGEVKVNLINHGDGAHEVKRGDRIAQLLILPVAQADLELVDDLSPSERAEGGFGSTGR
jgi:dUTP pyrophosphatase